MLTGLNIPENISYVRISRNGEEKELTDPKDIEKAIEAVSVLNCGLHSSNTNNSHSEEIMYVFKFKYPSTIFISGGDGLILYDGHYYKSKDDSLNKLIEITDEYFF